jgi:hypothetical protein
MLRGSAVRVQAPENPMREVASRNRNRNQPVVIFDDLCDPYRQPVRPWLHLHSDEMAPAIVDSERPNYVTWSSLWIKRPDACVRSDLTAARGGTDLRWTLYVDDPLPTAGFVKHMCQRIGELIKGNLRFTYGQ